MAAGRQLVKEWFDGLERQLTEEAHHAGLLGHATMTGNAREFFVRHVLQSFLPARIRVGTGKVIGGESGRSKQVDIVLYEDRFPVFRLPDGQESRRERPFSLESRGLAR